VTHKRSALAAATGAAVAIKDHTEIIATPVGSPARPISAPLAQFGAHTAAFTSQALGAQWSCFYFLDAEGEPFGFQVHRTPWALRESYLTHLMARSDPLHPARLVTQNLRFVSMFDPRLNCALELRRNFWNFLSAFGTRDAAEMIFRVGGRAVAGMSLLWVGQAGSRADRQLGESMQSYIEFNLAAHYSPSLANLSTEASVGLALTDRELEIVQLVCQGSSNAQIAQRLAIGVSTVKTHLLHVFEKFGVRTRAALVGRCLLANTPSNEGSRRLGILRRPEREAPAVHE
jgi:DNA-binding CsgD family transcriptional regulator